MTQEQIDMLERWYNNGINFGFPLYNLIDNGSEAIDDISSDSDIINNMTAEQEIEFLEKYIEMAKEENEYNAKNN